jgi:hypothetical protein
MDPEVSQETNKANLLAREQHYLEFLFSLPQSFRYNFLSTAGSSLGYNHSEETRPQISGANNPIQSNPILCMDILEHFVLCLGKFQLMPFRVASTQSSNVW